MLLFTVALYIIVILRFNNHFLSLLFLGIVFLNLDAEDGSFPKKAEYKLRLNPEFTRSTKWIRAKLVVTYVLVFGVFLCCQSTSSDRHCYRPRSSGADEGTRWCSPLAVP